jgi:hypothetical protein
LYPSSSSTASSLLLTMFASITSTAEPDTSTSSIPSWTDLQTMVGQTVVGQALNNDLQQRKEGYGAPHVHNTLRKFNSIDNPKITLYRDHAGELS